MAILPEGFALPPLPYLVALVAGLVGVGVGLTRTRPTVTPAHVFALFIGLAAGTLSVVWPGTALVAALVVTPLTWRVVTRLAPEAAAAGSLGLLALFGHALDALSTAVGVDVLGFGERTPLSRVILDAAAALPTAEVIGVGWLFVLVKLAVAGFVVALLADYVREDPTEGSLLLGLVAAVGLGPGVHNLLLFAIAG